MSDRGWDEAPDPFDDLNVLDDADTDDELIDFARVHADDAFLDALGASLREGERPAPTADDLDDAELALLLASWRDEVDAEPIATLVDPRLAVDTVFTARARKQRRPRVLVPFAAAAAVLAIAFTGAGLAARDAQPGDTLWGLTKVLYADHARSVEAADTVRRDLIFAQTALAEGDLAEARSKLEAAGAGLPSVATEDGYSDLAAQHADLVSKLPDNPADHVQAPPSANPTTVASITSQAPGEATTTAVLSSTTDPTLLPSSPTTSNEQPTTTNNPPPTTTIPPSSEVPRSEPATGGTAPADTADQPAATTP